MSDKTIVALYDDLTDANRVLGDLESSGLRKSFQILGGGHAQGHSDFAGFSGDRGVLGQSLGQDYDAPANRIGTLTRLGVPQGDAEVYAEGLRRGGVLLVGHIAADHVDTALDIIERHGPVDIEERQQHYRSAGWTGYDATSEEYDETLATEERSRYGTGLTGAATALRDTDRGTGERISRTDADMGEEHIPIVEENVAVGKRSVERGGVRVRSYMVETPVEEQVRLRDETISVERRPVTGTTGDIPADAFRERSISMTETDEEAVVGKEARVREEVVVRKDVEQRTETVHDTARRTEVEIDKTPGRTTTDRTDR